MSGSPREPSPGAEGTRGRDQEPGLHEPHGGRTRKAMSPAFQKGGPEAQKHDCEGSVEWRPLRRSGEGHGHGPLTRLCPARPAPASSSAVRLEKPQSAQRRGIHTEYSGWLSPAHGKANPGLAVRLDPGPCHVSRSTSNKLPESSRGHSKN